MDTNTFEGIKLRSKRVIHTPSDFAKGSLIWLQEAGSLEARQQYTSRRENLSSYLMFTVDKGSGELVFDNESHALKKGDVVFIDCRMPYSHTTSKNLWTLSWVHFNGSAMPGIYAKYRERGGGPVLHTAHYKRYLKLAGDIYSIAADDGYLKDMRLNSSLNLLLELLMEDAWDPSKAMDFKGRRDLSDVKLYLDEHMSERISLDMLSARFFINKYYLSRLFRERYGVSIGTYLADKRITTAKYMLRFSGDSVERIGVLCGYEDANYFSRIFKQVEGISPGTFRKLWNA